MRVLITGAEGQDGNYLTRALRDRGHQTVGTALHQDALIGSSSANVTLDVTDRHATHALVAAVAPDAIVHLAAISNVPFAKENPDLARAVNVGGLINVLDAVRAFNPEIHVVSASSVEVFAPNDGLINEESPLGGVSVYAQTKQEALMLARESDLAIANVLMSNHESPLRTSAFVTGKVAAAVAHIARGGHELLTLGNLDVHRDWSAAQDVVAGIVKVIEQRFFGDVILASGRSHSLRELVAAAFMSVGISDWQPHVQYDATLVRTEAQRREFDVTKAREELGWEATTPLAQWIGDMVRAEIERAEHAAGLS